jgi:uncharacterized protein (DUF1684 family)
VAGPDGWLTVIGLDWLEEGSNPIGSDPASRIRLPAGPSRLGSIDLDSFGVRLVSDEGWPQALRDDEDGEPTEVRIDRVNFFVIRREGRLAVRVRDPASPARAAFAGLTYFPIDPGLKVEARFEPYPPGRSLRLPTVLSGHQTYPVPGALAFDLDGQTYRLDAYEEAGEDDLFVMFGDTTNRDRTFGGGRYLYVEPAGPDGLTEVDFNKAYNPPCVFTAFATCALSPPSNRLPISIEVGELRYEGPPAS